VLKYWTIGLNLNLIGKVLLKHSFKFIFSDLKNLRKQLQVTKRSAYAPGTLENLTTQVFSYFAFCDMYGFDWIYIRCLPYMYQLKVGFVCF
jgi:hypothetical protein